MLKIKQYYSRNTPTCENSSFYQSICYLKFLSSYNFHLYMLFNWKKKSITDGVITYLEPDILECEVKWALGSITMNKTSGGYGILVKLFQVLKDDIVKVLHSICQQIWRTQQWPQDWKRSVFIPIPKKGNAKECSNYCTIALISHTNKVMLKILQAICESSAICESWTSRCSSWF